MSSIRILIVDDHPVFRFGLRALLTAEADTEVVGEATTGTEAVALAANLMPDLEGKPKGRPSLWIIKLSRQKEILFSMISMPSGILSRK